MTFDPIQYKATTRQQWEDFAGGWNAWASLLETWLGPATKVMLDQVRLQHGDHVLDVAAGAGGQTLAAARRVGPEGSVLATDLSPTILEHAARVAERADVSNVATRELDGERLDELESGSFDAVISRLGLIYFPDRARALSGIHRALREGGRFATVTYASAADNGFFAVPVSLIRERAALPAPAPGQPGPFSLADPEVVADELTRAGFHDIEVDVIDAPVLLSSAAECTRWERQSFGALHQMLGALSAADQAAVWDEIESALTAYETDDGFVGPCRLVIASGSR